MRPYSLLAAFLALAACSSNPSSDPGGGTQTLLVNGSAGNENGNANFRVTVVRANVPVTDASVKMSSDLGETTLLHTGGGVYTAVGAGWGRSYTVQVTAGTDEAHGTVVAPEPAPVTAPTPTVAFDAHAAATVTLSWAGALSDSVRVESDHLDWGPAQDPGTITVAASIFTHTSQEIRVTRTNRIVLAGGIVGSQLSANIQTRTDLLVTNPF